MALLCYHITPGSALKSLPKACGLSGLTVPLRGGPRERDLDSASEAASDLCIPACIPAAFQYPFPGTQILTLSPLLGMFVVVQAKLNRSQRGLLGCAGWLCWVCW